MRALMLAGVAALVVSGTAQASVIPVLDNVTPDGSNFKFAYDGQLAPDQGVMNGSQLVIVDFAGYVDGSVHSSLANVTASVSNTLPAGLLLDPSFTDNATIPDLVFTYTGPDFHTTGGPFTGGPEGGIIHFTGLSADSIFGGTTAGAFSASAVKNTGAEQGSVTLNTGEVSVPLSAVPEPASWALMIMGFLGLGTALRLGRARSYDTVSQA
jgi:hypothetical protein